MLALYLKALLLTLAIEVPLMTWQLRDRSLGRRILAALVANLTSHPLLHFALPRLLMPIDRGSFTLIGEGLVLAYEILVLLAIARPRPWTRAVTAAALSNLASFAVGLLLF